MFIEKEEANVKNDMLRSPEEKHALLNMLSSVMSGFLSPEKYLEQKKYLQAKHSFSDSDDQLAGDAEDFVAQEEAELKRLGDSAPRELWSALEAVRQGFSSTEDYNKLKEICFTQLEKLFSEARAFEAAAASAVHTQPVELSKLNLPAQDFSPLYATNHCSEHLSTEEFIEISDLFA